ncbi:MAG: hypothetical protein K2X99_03590 [Gemmatimonadaceae bacterium]|nr:hypothetical protein [Gemmatimonadaceae bacterium]
MARTTWLAAAVIVGVASSSQAQSSGSTPESCTLEVREKPRAGTRFAGPGFDVCTPPGQLRYGPAVTYSAALGTGSWTLSPQFRMSTMQSRYQPFLRGNGQRQDWQEIIDGQPVDITLAAHAGGIWTVIASWPNGLVFTGKAMGGWYAEEQLAIVRSVRTQGSLARVRTDAVKNEFADGDAVPR